MQEENPGFFSAIGQYYELLVNTVIRPMRAHYRIEDLGPSPCRIGKNMYERIDLQLRNSGGYRLECSWWKPLNPPPGTKRRPCIIASHGNSSCRLGCLPMLPYALEGGCTVFALDFCGSGQSEGQYVSLGYHESIDLEAATAYLRGTGEVTSVVLWGRSMGSVAALLYAERDPTLNALVLDVPFSKLSKLVLDLVDEGKLEVPKFAVSIVMRLVQQSIKKRANFDIYQLKPISKIDRCTIPAFFGQALEDELIPPSHCEELYKRHGGTKQRMSFAGGHNSPRPPIFYHTAMQFVQIMLNMPITYGYYDQSKPPPSIFSNQILNPLEEGQTRQDISSMSIHDLRLAIERTGFSHDHCIEKSDLENLVERIYDRYQKLSQVDQDAHNEDEATS